MDFKTMMTENHYVIKENHYIIKTTRTNKSELSEHLGKKFKCLFLKYFI